MDVEKKEAKLSFQDRERQSSLSPLYLARTLAAWGDRTWNFVGGMFMLQLGESDTSLQLVGIYGLVSCLALLLFGAAIGKLVDNTPRNRYKGYKYWNNSLIHAFRLVICAVFTQNISVVLACIIMAVHFSVGLLSINIVKCSSISLLGNIQKWPFDNWGNFYSNGVTLHIVILGFQYSKVCENISISIFKNTYSTCL